MFYNIKLKDYVALDSDLFEEDLTEAIKKQILRDYMYKVTEDFGFIISVIEIEKIGEGFKLPEDSSRHYVVEFSVISFLPEIHEYIVGDISSITEFGAFVNLGVIEGLVHLTQTMNEQVSYSKTGLIQSNKSNKSLKEKDIVKAKIVAISFKDLRNIKIGLTMRQPGLGNIVWEDN